MKYGAFMAELRKMPPKHVYLLAGEERYYIEKAKQYLLEKLFPKGEELRNGLEQVSGDLNADALIGLIESVPFFSKKHVVLVQDSPLFRTKDADSSKKHNNAKKDERLLETLTHMPEYAYVIFLCHTAADKRRKVYKTIQEIGSILEADALRPWNVSDWLNERLAEMQRELDSEAYAYFMGAIGMMHEISLSYLDREFEKLALYTPKKRIGKEELVAIFAGLPEVSSFAMIDAINEKNAEKALSILRRQVEDGIYPPVLLALLVRHVRQLWQAKLFIARGVKGKQLGVAMKLSPFIATKLSRVSADFSTGRLKEVLLSLIEADYLLKTGQSRTELLENIVLSLCR